MDGDGDPDFVDANGGYYNEVLFNQLNHPTQGGCSDITVNSAAGQCGATVTYSHNVTDNCSATISYAPASGSFFPVGTTAVTATAEDPSGNKTTCTFNVIVVDNIPPVITCPVNINVYATSAAGAVVNYATPVGTDNCSGASTVRIAGLGSGSTFPIGTTTVTHRVTDAAGLTASCSFTVTVTGLAPEVHCPSDITVNNTPGVCGASVTFAATETRGIPASVITYSVQPGTVFPVGVTTVFVTATNAVGVSTCSFTVRVVDNQLPVITVPSDITVNNTAGNCGAVVGFNAKMIASNGGAAAGAQDGGAIMSVNSATAASTVIGTPVAGSGITGIDFASNGTLYGIKVVNSGTGASLITINPSTGSLVSTIGAIRLNGNAINLTDMAIQPGTNTIYGTTTSNQLVTINATTAAATLIGQPVSIGLLPVDRLCPEWHIVWIKNQPGE
jgi:large repetitive protein